jgi:ABC-type branched-subunit amino acid transport system substrate-binding protein
MKKSALGNMKKWAFGCLVVCLIGAASLTADASTTNGQSTHAVLERPMAKSSSKAAPILLYGYGVLQSAAFGFPEMQSGAAAAVASINSRGGVNGHHLKLMFCNDQNDPNQALSCAHSIVGSKAVAEVGTVTTMGPQVVPVLAAAGIAEIGPDPVSPIEYTSPDVYLIDGGTLSSYGGLAPWAAKLVGAKTAVAVYTSTAQLATNQALVNQGAAGAGVTISQSITIPPNTLDLSPYVAQIAALKPDAIIAVTVGTDMNNLWNAVKSQGLSIPMFESDGSATPQALAAANGTADGSYAISQFPLVSDPSMGQFRHDMNTYEKSASQDSVSQRAWASVELFATVARSIKGQITRKSVKAALNKVHNLNLFWIKGLSFNHPGPFKSSPRVVNAAAYASEIIKGRQVVVGAGPISVKP